MPPTEEGGERWETAEGTPLRRWKRSGDRKNPQSKRRRAGRGAGFRNSGSPTRISKQLIGGNADELRTRTGNDVKRLGEQLSPSRLPSIPVLIGRRDRWRGRGGGSPNRGIASPGRIPPPNGQPKEQTFGGDLPPKFCPFGCWPFPPIGELADGRYRMAPIFNRPPIARIGSD